MIPLERFRKFFRGADATTPKSKWAEPSREAQTLAVVPKQSFLLKFRSIVGVLLVINVCIGGYLIAKTTPKSKAGEKKRGHKKEAAVETQAQINLPARKIPTPQRKVTANEQRQLFKWMLDEKRKIKPGNSIEKASIDEDKKIPESNEHALSVRECDVNLRNNNF